MKSTAWQRGFCAATWILMAGLMVSGCERAGEHEAGGAAAPAAASAATGDADGVTLTAAQIEKAGIETRPVTALSWAAQVDGYGLVLAHDGIAQSVAEVATAAATARQSSAALARARGLEGTAGAFPADAVELAVRQAAVDRAALDLARQRLSATLGQNRLWGPDADSALLHQLANGSVKLVRVSFPLGALDSGAPGSLRLARLDAEPTATGWNTATLWEAPADPTVPGRSFFALLSGTDAREGERLLAWASHGPARHGFLVPASAVVVSAGKTWCYVAAAAGRFTRVGIDTSAPVAGGYFVTDGLTAGAQLVTASAGLLLARETQPSGAAE